MEETSEGLTIQQVAEGTGLTVHTLRYYERAGLFPPIARNGGGHRRYTQSDVRFLVFLTRLRTTGMPIHRVRRYAELVREGDATLPARLRILEDHRDAVRLHMAGLVDNLEALEIKIALYADGNVPPHERIPNIEVTL